MKVVRGKTVCSFCSSYWSDDPTQAPTKADLDLLPRATGRDGLCTGCRSYRRINLNCARWDLKQDPQPPAAWVDWQREETYDWWYEVTFGPRDQRPAARWRAKIRRSKHR